MSRGPLKRDIVCVQRGVASHPAWKYCLERARTRSCKIEKSTCFSPNSLLMFTVMASEFLREASVCQGWCRVFALLLCLALFSKTFFFVPTFLQLLLFILFPLWVAVFGVARVSRHWFARVGAGFHVHFGLKLKGLGRNVVVARAMACAQSPSCDSVVRAWLQAHVRR